MKWNRFWLAAQVTFFAFSGYVYDTESGLYYLQSRYYNPETSRFINADILVSTGQGLLGNNMFAYCGNNPVSRIDSYDGESVTFHYNRHEDNAYIEKKLPAIDFIKQRGGKDITFLCVIAAPIGLEKLMEAHPDIKIFVGNLDRELNEKAYICPGLGDAGDRIFGTK